MCFRFNLLSSYSGWVLQARFGLFPSQGTYELLIHKLADLQQYEREFENCDGGAIFIMRFLQRLSVCSRRLCWTSHTASVLVWLRR